MTAAACETKTAESAGEMASAAGVLEVKAGRTLPGLLIAVLLLGVADSITGPYRVLFASDRAGLSPLAVGVFMSATGISGMAVSTWLGRRYDRSPSRLPALFALAASAVGFALLALTTSYVLLLIIAVVFLGTSSAAFPQLFALARHHLDKVGTTARATPALRSMWSMAWAIGPLVGGVALAWHGFTALFLLAAATFVLVGVPVLWLGAPPPATIRSSSDHADGSARLVRPLVPVVVAFGLFNTAMLAGSVALPLYVTEQMNRPYGDVGLMFSVAAVVELVAALVLTRLPAHADRERVILFGFALFVAYFAVVAVASNMALVIVAQVARGVAISAVGALGITYFQDLLPERAGRATTLFSNTAVAGSLVSGILAGATIEMFGNRVALILCGVLSLVGGVLMLSARCGREIGSFQPGPPVRVRAHGLDLGWRTCVRAGDRANRLAPGDGVRPGLDGHA